MGERTEIAAPKFHRKKSKKRTKKQKRDPKVR